MEAPGMWSVWVGLMWGWVFPPFLAMATGGGIVALWWGLAALVRRALLATLEVATIVEAAREAKRQDRAPILRAWTRLEKRWRDGG